MTLRLKLRHISSEYDEKKRKLVVRYEAEKDGKNARVNNIKAREKVDG